MTTLASQIRETVRDTFEPTRYDSTREAGMNVADSERIISGLGGGLLAGVGIARGGIGGIALAVLGASLVHRAVTGHCYTYDLLGIDTRHQGRARADDFFDHGIHVEEAFTVNRPADELYRFWHDFSNLPRFMLYLDEVRVLDEKRSHWVARGPAGRKVEWEAVIINDEPGELIAWRSLEGAQVDNAGSVRFLPAPHGRGTEVKVVVDYIPPAGQIGKAVAMLFGRAPEQTIREDLRRFKQLMEAGESPTVQGQPRGTCSWLR